MTFDGLFTKWMKDEMAAAIVGGRISKIHQPLPHEVRLTIRSNRQNYYLLCSVHPTMARVHFVSDKGDNPESAPTFCMILRKHLEGAIIEQVTQVESDRIIQLDTITRNEMGDPEGWRLTIELMGKHSNMFLINRKTNGIVDCLKRIPFSQNSYRTLQPGAMYQLPPHQKKKNPFSFSLFELDALLAAHQTKDEACLTTTFQGISKQAAHEIVERAETLHLTVAEALYHYIQEGNTQRTPTLTTVGSKQYFTPFSYLSLGPNVHSYATLSQLLETYYAQKAQSDRIQQLAGNLLHMLQTELKKNREKLVYLDEDMSKTEQADQWRIKGELINIYQHQLKKGQSSVLLPNFYNDNEELVVALDTRLTPSQNAQAYFKKYQKLRNSVAHIEAQKEKTLQEIDYIENILVQIEDSDSKNLEIIREELVQSGYLKRQLKKGKQKLPTSKPYEFYATDGTRILVGRNNLQNDQLTLKMAKKEYLWLHAQNIPGSHVIIESAHPSDETIGQAAMLAAYYSKYRHSATVPVDYVSVSKIRKPNGAKPGFVVYEGQQNTYITPDEAIIEQLRKKPSL